MAPGGGGASSACNSLIGPKGCCERLSSGWTREDAIPILMCCAQCTNFKGTVAPKKGGFLWTDCLTELPVAAKSIRGKIKYNGADTFVIVLLVFYDVK